MMDSSISCTTNIPFDLLVAKAGGTGCAPRHNRPRFSHRQHHGWGKGRGGEQVYGHDYRFTHGAVGIRSANLATLVSHRSSFSFHTLSCQLWKHWGSSDLVTSFEITRCTFRWFGTRIVRHTCSFNEILLECSLMTKIHVSNHLWTRFVRLIHKSIPQSVFATVCRCVCGREQFSITCQVWQWLNFHTPNCHTQTCSHTHWMLSNMDICLSAAAH